jgi:hypothetical protein
VKPTRPQVLAAIAAVSALAAWVVVRATFASLPPLPWSAVPALLVIAAGELLLARNLRARMHGHGKPLAATGVAQAAALARASSAGAAVFGGLGAGFLIFVTGYLGRPVPDRDALAAGATLASAAALTCAALYLESCCRAPRPPDSDDDPPSADNRSYPHYPDIPD